MTTETNNLPSEVWKERIQAELHRIERLGYATRLIPRDNETKGSWGYTVGLFYEKSPICLFIKGGVDSSLLDHILCEVADQVKESGTFPDLFHVPCFFIDYEQTVKARLRLKLLTLEQIQVYGTRDQCIVEGQAKGTLYAQILLPDQNNVLPGEKGYTDFLQMTDTVPNLFN